jgi:hypothetical protein
VSQHEPFSEEGSNMGLNVMLDAHNSILASSSVYTDFEGPQKSYYGTKISLACQRYADNCYENLHSKHMLFNNPLKFFRGIGSGAGVLKLLF